MRFGAPLSYELFGEIAAWRKVCKQAAHTLGGLAASLNFRASVFGRVGHGPMVPAAPEAIAEDSANSLHLVTEGAKQKAYTDLRSAQAAFERAETERDKASSARRKSFERAQKTGMTLREIGEVVGLHHTRVSEILRGQ